MFAGGCIQNIFLVCRSAVFDSACCQAVFKQECHVQDASAYFCVCFWRDDGRKFFRRQVPGTDGAGRKEDYPGRIWGCGAADRPGSGCTGKK